jgi:hypothetical protein
MSTNLSAQDWELWKVVLQGVGYIGGWVAIVIGWKVSWGHHLKREERKDFRDAIDRLVDQVEETERQSIDFLTAESDSKDEKIALQIRNNISRLSRSLSRLKTHRRLDCTSQVILFRQAITGGDLDSRGRKPLMGDSEQLKGIGAASHNLIDQMEMEYVRLTKDNKWS